MSQEEYDTFKLGDWELQSGEKLVDAHLAYKTFGDPASPAIVYPSWFSGLLSDNYWLIGEDKTLNPKKYFIIVPALFGNVIGWSMGAAQTYQWATQYPDFMDLAVPFCGSAKTSLHNKVFLEGVKSALLAAKHIPSAGSGNGGLLQAEQSLRTWSDTEKEVGLKAFGRGYAGWGFSQAFYREKLYETALGFKDLEDFMQNFWESWALSKDPGNLLTMLQTWQNGDVSKQEPFNGNFEKALGSIKAKTLVLPSKTDLYFPPEDSEYEVAFMQRGIGTLKVFPSIWGHWAGGPGQSKEDVKWLNEQLAEFFDKY